MTAVEWLQMKMATSSPQEMVENINVWFEEANQMHKEQIMEAHVDGSEYSCDSAEEYYNKTYGK